MPVAEPGLNRVEVAVSVIYATLWAFVPASALLNHRQLRLGAVHGLFLFELVSPPVCAFITTFVLALVAHLFAASRCVPRERLDVNDQSRLVGAILFSVIMSAALSGMQRVF